MEFCTTKGGVFVVQLVTQCNIHFLKFAARSVPSAVFAVTVNGSLVPEDDGRHASEILMWYTPGSIVDDDSHKYCISPSLNSLSDLVMSDTLVSSLFRSSIFHWKQNEL